MAAGSRCLDSLAPRLIKETVETGTFRERGSMGPKTIGILPEKHGENMGKTWGKR